MEKIYRSKLGLELVIPISIVFGIVFFMMLANDPNWLGMIIVAAVLLFFIYLFQNTYYTIQDKTLLIQCGVLYQSSIDIQHIQRISETNNPLSAPAASLDRLEIKYHNNRFVLVSPQDKQAFIQHLLALNPAIEVRYKKQ